MRKVTLGNYRADPYYPRVVRAVNEILSEGHVVAPIDVFTRMELLSAEDLENWRFGRVPYLERCIRCNLSKAERVLRLLRLYAEASGLKASHTAYRRWGKGPKQPLQFSRFGHPRLEGFYSTHFIRPGRGPATTGHAETPSSPSLPSAPRNTTEAHTSPEDDIPI